MMLFAACVLGFILLSAVPQEAEARRLARLRADQKKMAALIDRRW